jgi:hypothetical protein
LAGIPEMMRRSLCGVSRTVPVWQSAQFIPTRSMMTRRFEKPTGVSRPGSWTRPKFS